jgi:hypothetical protein
MARIRLTFRSLTLFEDEEAGDTHMALYATISTPVPGGTAFLASFKWNNAGVKVDEVNTYQLDNDASNPNVVDVEVSSYAIITVEAYADDDQDWPSARSNENFLGTATVSIDPRDPSSIGSLTIGPTRTDNNNTGYQISVDSAIAPAPSPAEVRIHLENLILYEDEEAGDTHMAIYVHAEGPAINQEIFRWNNANNKVDEVNSFALDNGSASTTIRLSLQGPTRIWVEGYADDDQDWPSSGNNENSLGQAQVVVDPNDPSTLGQRQLGPTQTDQGNIGYAINLSVEVLPGPSAGPDLLIVGIEVTQAIQHFRSPLGVNNSLPLVANKLTLVRVYLDSGLDPALGGGTVANVTGTLLVTGSANLSLAPIASMTARPIATVNPVNFTDTLNFLIPAENANGTLDLTVQASVASSVSNPFSQSVSFSDVSRLNIVMFRIQSGSVSGDDSTGGPPSEASYFAAVNRLPLVYPIPSDPGKAITYWVVPGAEDIHTPHDLNTEDGMKDLLGDLEDILEDANAPSFKKAYGLVPATVAMNRFGWSRPFDNVGIGWPFIMESVAHEIGHLYGLDHAPCGGPFNGDVDDDFVPPNGLIGEVGADPVGRQAFPPQFSDFMSYCGDGGATPYETQWISAYHWIKLFITFKYFF